MGAIFDGVNGKFVVTANAAVKPASMTLGFWCFVSSLGVIQNVISDSRTADDTGFQMFLLNDDKFYFQAGNSGTPWPSLNMISSAILSIGWYYVIASISGSASSLYVGKLGSSLVQEVSIGGFTISASTRDLWIGGQPQGGAEFPGFINNIVMWNTGLSQTQAEQVYNSKLVKISDQVLSGNVTGRWYLDDGEDGTSAALETAHDSSGNGSDGAGSGGVVWKAEEVLSYPGDIITMSDITLPPEAIMNQLQGNNVGAYLLNGTLI
ncbi:hypothetical protein KAR91_50990 [Candidatus Pacearchaeota archaeon]|nr:hypothetical protein [Candidatus Pacearchaeota archaeon]